MAETGLTLSSKRYLQRRATTVFYDDFSSGRIDTQKWSHDIMAVGLTVRMYIFSLWARLFLWVFSSCCSLSFVLSIFLSFSFFRSAYLFFVFFVFFYHLFLFHSRLLSVLLSFCFFAFLKTETFFYPSLVLSFVQPLQHML